MRLTVQSASADEESGKTNVDAGTIIMGRFSWSQLTEWEEAAVNSRVPKEIPGLIPRSRLPNNR